MSDSKRPDDPDGGGDQPCDRESLGAAEVVATIATGAIVTVIVSQIVRIDRAGAEQSSNRR